MDHASVTTTNGNTVNSVASYVCDTGYTLTDGDKERTCGPDNRWSGTPPVCEKGTTRRFSTHRQNIT